MRRLIAVGVLACFITAVCVTGTATVGRTGRQVGALLEEALDAAARGDAESARAAAQQAEAAYVAAEGWANCFVHHDLVEDLGVALARLPGLAVPESLDDFIAEGRAALVMLTHVVKDERPSLGNVL